MSPAGFKIFLWSFAAIWMLFSHSTESYKERSTCGYSSVNFRYRIVGGKISTKGMWPWQIGIYRINDHGKNFIICGGALISRAWVLTAAHCFYQNEVFNGNTSLYLIKAGDHNLSTNEVSEQEIVPERFFIYHEYNYISSVDFDIALVKLSHNVDVHRFVQTVCLPEKDEGDLAIPTTNGIVAGWGVTRALRLGELAKPDDISKVLRHSVFTIQKDQLCLNKTVIHYNSTVTFCAGDGKGGSDTCQGDSGGAFVREIRRGRKLQWVVTGVVSWGEGCAQKDKYGYYTRVYPFIDWIKKTMEEPSSCVPPQIPANAEFWRSQKGKTTYMYSDIVLFRCKLGYFSKGIGLRICGFNGWSGPSFICSPKSCGNPGNPRNGKILSYIFTFKSKVYFQCNYGYQLVGDKFRQCQSNQKWSGRLPTCEPIDCGVLPIPDKAEKVLETHTRVHGVVRFKCKEKGYEISGSEMRTCQNNGLWSGVTTWCKMIICGNPGTPMNGKQVNVQNNYNYGSSVEFACNDNYTLAGTRKITCEETKDWSSPIPRCWAPCSDPGVPSSGSRTGNNFLHGNSVSFKCYHGFELKGDKTMTCTDGGWNGFKPQCKAVSCGDPGTPLHGRQAKVTNNYSYGGFIQFKCDQNYTLEGKSKLTCQTNKEWNGKIPKCLAPCPKPDQPLHGKRIGDDFRHAAVLKFECFKGYFLKGPPVMICNNGQWNRTLPICTDCDGRGKPLGMSNGVIPDSSIRASSQRDQNHAAHYGRLGGNSYWCSKNEGSSHMEIDLPKKYKITAVKIEVQDSSNIRWILLYSHFFQKWFDLYTEHLPFKPGQHQIVVTEPFVADRIRLRLIRARGKKDSLCLRAEIYGCEAPRGCIMAGSAVLAKWDGRYWKGYVGQIERVIDSFETLQPGRSRTVQRVDAVLDEKADSSELTKGTLVLVKDFYSDQIREGEIVQAGNPLCSVKTKDGIVKRVHVNNVRVVKQSRFCPT